MKTLSLAFAAVIVLFPASAATDPAAVSVAARGPHTRVWQKEVADETESGTRTKVSSYTEVATGLHYWDGTQWQDSREEIEIVADGAAANRGQHTAHWNGNLNTFGAIALTTPDGKLMRSHVYGVYYHDTAQGLSTCIAPIRDCNGLLLPPNEVIYPSAFGPVADARFTYTKAGLEQDIIIREQLCPPADYGFNPARLKQSLRLFLQARRRC
jgi:hypothetical protein